MNRYEAAHRLDQLEQVGRRHGHAPPKSTLTLRAEVEVSGGRLLTDPDVYATDVPTRHKYRILYESADGLRRADVTRTSDAEIVALLQVESLRWTHPVQ